MRVDPDLRVEVREEPKTSLAARSVHPAEPGVELNELPDVGHRYLERVWGEEPEDRLPEERRQEDS